MQVQMTEIGCIRPNPKNLRKHSAKQIGQIAASIKAFGFTNPLLVAAEDHMLLAGHGRYEAAKQLGLTEVPVVLIAGLSAAKRQALAIIDNKLGDNSTWDKMSLAAELPRLESLLLDEGVEPALLGFKPLEIRHHQSVAKARATRKGNAQQITGGSIPVAKLGDLFKLKDHTILCGDPCAGAMQRLMNNRRADFVYIDSPVENLGSSDKSISPDGFSTIYRVLSDAASVSRTGAVNVFTTTSDGQLTKNASRPCSRREEDHGAARQKADKLLVGLINAATRRGDLILGISQNPSSMITVADQTGRLACVIAKAPNEVDVAIRRWQAITGLKATHADNGLLFDALAHRRSDGNRENLTGEKNHGAR